MLKSSLSTESVPPRRALRVINLVTTKTESKKRAPSANACLHRTPPHPAAPRDPLRTIINQLLTAMSRTPLDGLHTLLSTIYELITTKFEQFETENVFKLTDS